MRLKSNQQQSTITFSKCIGVERKVDLRRNIDVLIGLEKTLLGGADDMNRESKGSYLMNGFAE